MVALPNARTHRQRQAGRFGPPTGGARHAHLAGFIAPAPNICLWPTSKDEQICRPVSILHALRGLSKALSDVQSRRRNAHARKKHTKARTDPPFRLC